jgi:hypothetical protein
MQNEKVIELLCSLVKNESSQESDCSLEVGKCYLIRTVTMMYTGRLECITKEDFVLSDAAWIADSGRYSTALRTGELNEVEPYPNRVSVARASRVDAAEWNHPLPRETK